MNGSSLCPSIESFQSSIPLTSTPKHLNRFPYSQPLSSTLSMASSSSTKKLDLSISAITMIQKSKLSHKKKCQCYHRHHHHRRLKRGPIHSSTIIKRIELKDLLYSTRAMKKQQESQIHYYTKEDLKIYVI